MYLWFYMVYALYYIKKCLQFCTLYFDINLDVNRKASGTLHIINTDMKTVCEKVLK